MRCERYWREGVVLVESGLVDLHRESCDDCRRAHAQRDEIVRALPAVGPASTGDPRWQARVWQQIARDEQRATAPARRGWVLGGAIAVVCAIAVAIVWWPEDRAAPYVTAVTIEKGAVVMRGDAQVGDTLRIVLSPAEEVRVYRGAELAFRCSQARVGAGCVVDARGSVAAYPLATAGEYKVVIVESLTSEVRGSFDRDLAALVLANITYRIDRELSVR